jgi:hypothetical protein
MYKEQKSWDRRRGHIEGAWRSLRELMMMMRGIILHVSPTLFISELEICVKDARISCSTMRFSRTLRLLIWPYF